MHESIFSSVIRAFLMALFAVIGFCIGLVLLFVLIGSFSESSKLEPEATFSVATLPNAEGERKVVSKEDPVILQINIDGVIGSEDLHMGKIRKMLIESREGDFKNNRVKALLLRINTPGGTVVDADGIYRAIKAYKEQYKVPVYAYVDGICASGGMYVAAAADKIYASDVSLIGSVGVISPSFFNFTQLIDKVGVQALTLTAGKDKDVLNPLRPWKPGEEAMIQELIDYYYDHFVNVVTSSLPIDKTKLVNDYGAKIFNPVQAQEYGFITATGYSWRDTLKQLLAAANITDEKYQVLELQHRSWFSELFNTQWPLLQGKIVHKFDLGAEMDPRLANQFLYLYRP